LVLVVGVILLHLQKWGIQLLPSNLDFEVIRARLNNYMLLLLTRAFDKHKTILQDHQFRRTCPFQGSGIQLSPEMSVVRIPA
jgi:hypothetical protein